MSNTPNEIIIAALGGTCAVAKICRVSPQAVSQWRRNGIPVARRMYLELKYPEAFSANNLNSEKDNG